MPEIIKTLRAGGGDYTDAQTWWDTEGGDYDYVTNATNRRLKCYNDWPGGKSEQVNLSAVAGYSANDTYYPEFMAADGEGHGGIPGGGFFLSKNAQYGVVLDLNADYLRVTGIEARNTAATYSFGVRTLKDTMVLKYVLARAGATYGSFYVNSSCTFICCGAIDAPGWAYNFQEWASPTLIGCVAKGCAEGFIKLGSQGSVTLKICASYENTGSEYWSQSGSWHASSTNNASSTASTVAPPGLNPITADVVAADFVNPSIGDMHLASGSTLIGAGANLYTNGADVDIDGDTRPNAAWDVGYDQYQSSGGASYSLVADPGSLEISGNAALLVAQRSLVASPSGVSINGVSAGLNQYRSIVAGGGALPVVGGVALLSIGRLLDAGGWSISINGSPVGLLQSCRLGAEGGAVSVAGSEVALSVGRLLSAASGQLSVTGLNAVLLQNRLLVAEPGSLPLVGGEVVFVAPEVNVLTAESGALAINGGSVALGVGRVLGIEGGVISIDGAAASLMQRYALRAESGALSIEGASVSLIYDSATQEGPGSPVIAIPGITFIVIPTTTFRVG